MVNFHVIEKCVKSDTTVFCKKNNVLVQITPDTAAVKTNIPTVIIVLLSCISILIMVGAIIYVLSRPRSNYNNKRKSAFEYG